MAFRIYTAIERNNVWEKLNKYIQSIWERHLAFPSHLVLLIGTSVKKKKEKKAKLHRIPYFKCATGELHSNSNKALPSAHELANDTYFAWLGESCLVSCSTSEAFTSSLLMNTLLGTIDILTMWEQLNLCGIWGRTLTFCPMFHIWHFGVLLFYWSILWDVSRKCQLSFHFRMNISMWKCSF